MIGNQHLDRRRHILNYFGIVLSILASMFYMHHWTSYSPPNF